MKTPLLFKDTNELMEARQMGAFPKEQTVNLNAYFSKSRYSDEKNILVWLSENKILVHQPLNDELLHKYFNVVKEARLWSDVREEFVIEVGSEVIYNDEVLTVIGINDTQYVLENADGLFIITLKNNVKKEK